MALPMTCLLKDPSGLAPLRCARLPATLYLQTAGDPEKPRKAKESSGESKRAPLSPKEPTRTQETLGELRGTGKRAQES